MVSISTESELKDAMKFAEDNRDILSDHGFVFISSERQTSQLVADFQIFGYHNKVTGMSLMVSFFPRWEAQSSNIFPILTDSSGRKLQIEDYLKKHERFDLIAQLTRGAACADVRDFLRTAYGALKTTFTTELKEIISGKQWEVIPFDWQGYK